MLRKDRIIARRVAWLAIALTTLATAAAAAQDPDLPVIDGEFATAILMDARTGEILAGKDIDARRQPASMVKMMTQLLVLERVVEGDLAMADTVTVSARASRMGGSQVWLKHGERFTIEQMLEALAIHSANDVAVALAEHLAGSVEAFVDLMNYKAADLGMRNSEFHSVHGLPAGRGQQPDLSSARDMAILGRALLAHPIALQWSSRDRAPFRDGEFILTNPNQLVGQFRGLDGLKTGYTGPAGYCVTATAVQKDVRLISVVMGCPSDRSRATESTRLLSYGFNLYGPVTLVGRADADVAEPVPVKGGKRGDVGLVTAAELVVTVRRDAEDRIQLRRETPDVIDAPVAEGQRIGDLVAVLDDHELGRVGLLAAEAVQKGSWYHRLLR